MVDFSFLFRHLTILGKKLHFHIFLSSFQLCKGTVLSPSISDASLATCQAHEGDAHIPQMVEAVKSSHTRSHTDTYMQTEMVSETPLKLWTFQINIRSSCHLSLTYVQIHLHLYIFIREKSWIMQGSASLNQSIIRPLPLQLFCNQLICFDWPVQGKQVLLFCFHLTICFLKNLNTLQVAPPLFWWKGEQVQWNWICLSVIIMRSTVISLTSKGLKCSVIGENLDTFTDWPDLEYKPITIGNNCSYIIHLN